MFGEGGSDVGESFTGAERGGVWAVEDEEGDLFAGVVGAGPGGVVAVVGGNDDEVGGRDLF